MVLTLGSTLHLLADSPAFFGQLVAVGKEPAEAFDAAGEVFIAIA